jgi:hypothetical protein
MENFFDLQSRIDKENEKQKVIDLAEAVFQVAIQSNPDMSQLKSRLIELLSFLCSPEGRTDENCQIVDSYFCTKNNWSYCIKHLPIEAYEILFDIGGTLHDTFENPDIAANFQSLPEQLLERVEKMEA